MRTFAAIAVSGALSGLLAACTVVSIDEDRDRRAQREARFDAPAWVARNWDSRVVPEIEKGAIPLDTVFANIKVQEDLAKFGPANGRMASEGSPWVFKFKGSGKVATIDTASRNGRLVIDRGPGQQLSLETNQVQVFSAIRDTLPFVDFNNFADQMAFASVSKALNQRAQKAIPSGLKPGDTVDFYGVMAVGDMVPQFFDITLVKIAKAN